MKNLLFITWLFVVFGLAWPVHAQYFSVPEPFIEGQSNKSGAFLGSANYQSFVLLWEQSTDTLSTAIHYMYYLNGGAEEVLLSEPGVHFQNPQIYNVYWGPDTSSTIVYEKTMLDKTELWFIKVSADGGFSEPFMMAGDGQVNNKFTFELTNNFFAWNADGHLLVSRVYYSGGTVIQEPDTVFTGPIHEIKFKQQNLFWITADDDSCYIMRSAFGSQPNWGEPEVIYSAREISSLAGAIHYADDGVLAFSYANDSVWKINNYSYRWSDPAYYPLGISNNEAYDFDVFSTYYGVKEDLEQYWLAMIKDTLGYREVFVKDYGFKNEFYQVSFLGSETRNPQFFLGEGVGQWGFNLYLIFEAKLNGFWQLYFSTLPIGWGSVQEQELIDGVSVFPNPATVFIRINNEKEADLAIEIFDMTGKRVYQDSFNEIENEIKTADWNRGIYFMRIHGQNTTITRKVILN